MIKKILNKSSKVLTYIGGGLTVVTFVQGLQQQQTNKTTIELLKTQYERANSIITNYENKNITDNVKTKLEVLGINVGDHADRVLKENDKIKEMLNKLNDPNLTETEKTSLLQWIDYHQAEINRIAKSCNSVLETHEEMFKLLDSISTNKLLDDFNIILTKYQNYLSSLPLEKVGALGHILLCIGMLLSVGTIIFVFYGDFLINYFKLEEKYPKLAVIIRLRRKFQMFYLSINICFMILSLLLIIYVNYVVFIN
jgi:hypothetical protein